MIKTDMRADPFCLFESWHGCLSEEDQKLPEARWLEWGRTGKWAVYLKIGSQRNRAWYRKTDIYAHFRLRYGVVRPDLLQALIDLNDGFEPAKPIADFPQNRKNQKRKKAKS